MIKYILKRILIFIPTLFVISLITFIISLNTPGDPVETMLQGPSGSGGQGQTSKGTDEKAYRDLRRDLGLDLPVFYFTITNSTIPDTLYRVPKLKYRENLERLAWEHGNWEDVSRFYLVARQLQTDVYQIERTKVNSKDLRQIKDNIYALLETHEDDKILGLISKMRDHCQRSTSIARVKGLVESLERAYTDMKLNASITNRHIPKFNWYGATNQYHNWLFGDEPWFGKKDPTIYYHGRGFFRGDFGKSYIDKRPVSSKMWEAVSITFMMSLIAMFITYICALPLGVFTAVHKGKKREIFTSATLFGLYSMPNFWIGTMMVTFLCNPDYVNWFPPAYSNLANVIPEDAGFWESFFTTAYHLILPLFCWTYVSLAYLSRQMRGGMLSSLGQDYIRTARAKGLSNKKVVWKHAFRNSLIPVITIFASVFPRAISGSIVIEVIFGIPGMGQMSWEAIGQRDYPVIFTVMMFTAILTLVGTLVADILYAVVDPRISYTSKR